MLPAAQLDRFLMRLSMGYPDRASQVEIMKDRHHTDPMERVQPVLAIPDLLAVTEQVTNVHVSDPIYNYITDLAEETRKHPTFNWASAPEERWRCAGQQRRVHLYMEEIM